MRAIADLSQTPSDTSYDSLTLTDACPSSELPLGGGQGWHHPDAPLRPDLLPSCEDCGHSRYPALPVTQGHTLPPLTHGD